MDREAARYFRQELQQARENALKNAEAWDDIIHCVERLGSFLTTSVNGLNAYKTKVQAEAELSPLATCIPAQCRNFHTPFSLLYSMVQDARNEAMHMGASARHLTTHAIELGLILEDALRMDEMSTMKKYVISDYMVCNPVCAYLWQPVSFIRQQMLTNSFSYLPVEKKGEWYLVSDLQVAKFLQKSRGLRLASSLEKAEEITLPPVKWLQDTTEVDSVWATFDVNDGKPILVFRDDEKKPVGIITPFDLL